MRCAAEKIGVAEGRGVAEIDALYGCAAEGGGVAEGRRTAESREVAEVGDHSS